LFRYTSDWPNVFANIAKKPAACNHILPTISLPIIFLDFDFWFS